MATYSVPYPSGVTWERWAAAVLGANPSLVQQASIYQDWKDFAECLSLVEPRTPRPTSFDNWQEWAEAFKEAVPSSI